MKDENKLKRTDLEMVDGDVTFFPEMFTCEESEHFLASLTREIAWEQKDTRFPGVKEPRLTSWYGDEGKSYTYSGITREALPWTPDLLEI